MRIRRFQVGIAVLLILGGAAIALMILSRKNSFPSEPPSQSTMERLPESGENRYSLQSPPFHQSDVNAQSRHNLAKKQVVKAAFRDKIKTRREMSEGGTHVLSEQELANLKEAMDRCADMTSCLDDGDFSAALAEARKLISSSNAAVRWQVYETLDWIGIEAVYDLADMMRDADSDLAREATESFWACLGDLPNDQAKLKLLNTISESDKTQNVRIAEELLGFHPYIAFELMHDMASSSNGEERGNILWDLEVMTGESFDTLDEWTTWYSQNKEALRVDYFDTDGSP